MSRAVVQCYAASAAMAGDEPIDRGGRDEVVRGDAQRIVTVADVVIDPQVVALLQSSAPSGGIAAGRHDQRRPRSHVLPLG